ncbi:hypothetical protein PI124_g20880 [Phytophthora idaei]|nr:hypothetical protein PI124_g20880 [Phytophthora idaei]
MAGWLSFSAAYNFVVQYKPGKNNILANALSRHPDYDPRRESGHHLMTKMMRASVELRLYTIASVPAMSLRDEIVASYESNSFYANIIAHLRAPSAESM